jgi:hypothetical protein
MKIESHWKQTTIPKMAKQMPASFSKEIATRLAKLCGMLGSDHAGERAAAGHKAHALVQSLGLTWFDVIAPTPAPRPVQPQTTGWRRMADYCLAHSQVLTPRETQFVSSIMSRRGELTERQENWLIDIYTRIRDEA